MRRWSWQISMGALLLCGLALAWQAAPTLSSSALPLLTDRGIGYDPLTANEAERALALALQANNKARPSADNNSAAQVEMLSIERYDAPKTSNTKAGAAAATMVRRGEVYLYDYSTDTLLHSIVDLASGTVQQEELHNVQRPLTAHEKARALQLVHDNAPLWGTLTSRFQTITGTELRTTDQLQVKISLFLGESMPDQVNAAARQCGEHRCAQILLFTVDRTVLEVIPIVDLSQGQVIQLLSDSWTTPHPATATEGSGT